MTDLGLEPRLRSLYDAEGSWAPDELRDRVLAIPEAFRPPTGAVVGRSRTIALLAAAVLLAVLLVALGALAGAGWVRPPWQAQSVLTAPADLDPCAVIDGAFVRLRAGGTAGSLLRGGVFSDFRFDHGGTMEPWGARVCAHGYDSSWVDPHLLLMPEPMSLGESELLLDSILPPQVDDEAWRTAGWTALAPGWWTAPGVDRGRDFQMVAVSADPYFFVVTASEEQRGWWGGIERPGALTLAATVRAELGDPPAGR